MGGSASKNKGSKFEREVAELLNKTYDTQAFRRTTGSGAIFGRSNHVRAEGVEESTVLALSSDIVCPSWFHYSIEVKHYKDKPNLATIIKSNDSILDGFLKEVELDTINAGRVPMLLFKINRQGIHIAVPKKLFVSEISHLSHCLIYNDYVIFGSDFLPEMKDSLLKIGDKFKEGVETN